LRALWSGLYMRVTPFLTGPSRDKSSGAFAV
jgi:hypothetical protein